MKRKFTLQCPMPEIDFDVITLGHGSGGRLTNHLLDMGVFQLFDNELLQARNDGATMDLSGRMAFSTDSFVVQPIFFPGGNIGELAVNGTVNDLAMCGAVPQFLSLGLILEEGLPVADLWEILAAIKITAENSSVRIVTGDTKVVEKGKGDKIFINTTGIGQVHPAAGFGAINIEPGDAIVVSNSFAEHGIAIMSVREGLTFESEIKSDTRPLVSPVMKLLDRFGSEIKILRDPTRGGIATVLNEMAGQYGIGISLEERNFPVGVQVRAACEMLGLDPLYVANEGIFIAIVSGNTADKVVRLLRGDPSCANAAIIGEVVANHAGKVFVRSQIGGRRVVGMLSGEQLPRIC